MASAEPATDSNPTFGVEQHGFDFIPETERKMTLRDLAYVWWGANAYLFFFSVGVIAFSLGLNVWEALLAVVVGNALFGYVAWGSIAGVRSGLPTMTLTRAAFGVRGNRLNGVFAWLTSVGFEALNTVFGVFAVAALLPVLGWHNGATAGKIAALVVVFFLSALVAVLGHATMVWVQRVFAIMLSLVLAAVFFYTIGGVNWSAGPAHPLPAAATIGAFFAAAAVVASGPLSYMFNCSDWPRYLPSRTPGKSIIWTVMWSNMGIVLLLGFMGVILSTRGNMSNPVAGLTSLIPRWLFILYAIAAVGGAVANNVLAFYASGLTLQSVGVPLRRYQATMLDTAVSTVLVIYVVFISSSFLTDVNDFLSLLLIWIGPFAGVWLVDGTLRRWSYDPVDIHTIRAGSRYWGWQGLNVKGLVAMLAGAAVCVLTIDSPILHGPVSKTLNGADLTWILGPAVAGAVYFVLARSRSGRARVSRQRTSSRRPRGAKRPQSPEACFGTTGYPGSSRASRSSMPTMCHRASMNDMTGRSALVTGAISGIAPPTTLWRCRRPARPWASRLRPSLPSAGLASRGRLPQPARAFDAGTATTALLAADPGKYGRSGGRVAGQPPWPPPGGRRWEPAGGLQIKFLHTRAHSRRIHYGAARLPADRRHGSPGGPGSTGRPLPDFPVIMASVRAARLSLRRRQLPGLGWGTTVAAERAC